ncbi:MAG: hypothetical protein EA402_14785 [Planctomycetota bacterium]|nr:MAG: hypothetical protein EA402_14785 [Planctomycetota bacterium]
MLTIETILLIGVAQVWFKKWLIEINYLPGWIKIALLMLLMVGVLGFLLVYLESAAKRSLASATGVVQAVPLPWSMILAHAAAIAGLFWLYGYVYGIQWLD